MDGSRKKSHNLPENPVEHAITPPKSFENSGFFRLPKLKLGAPKKKDIPVGVWTKCPTCGTMVFDKTLEENLKVCQNCDHHFPIDPDQRIASLVDPDSFREIDADLRSRDVLGFSEDGDYERRIKRDQEKTGRTDAIVTGLAAMGGRPVALAVMNFGFLGGSMGSVVGEKVARLVEAATAGRMPAVIISSSGGARMYEGMFSLMQMAKTSAALAYHAKQKLPYISVLTHPTTAGVMASYASLGDLIIAEPGAMIGFAGRRVIEATTQSELPLGFQTAEFLIDRGLIDAIVRREDLRNRLIRYVDYLMGPNAEPEVAAEETETEAESAPESE